MKRVIILSLLLFCAFNSNAQTTLSVTGGEATGSGGKVSYTVGQVLYTTYTGNDGFIVLGVQQPYEISVVTSIEEIINFDISIVAYPNPTSHLLKLRIETKQSDTFFYRFFDLNGRLLLSEKVRDFETTIDVGNMPSAIYILKIYSDYKEIKSFRIIKN